MSGSIAFVDDSGDTPVSGLLHGTITAKGDCLLLTHGAGSNSDSPLLIALAQALAATGLAVLRYDLYFRQQRPQGPPPRGSGDRDREGLRAAIAALQRRTAGRVFLGGHSYGGRQASMLAAEQPGLVSRLLLLSYPLHPPQRPTDLRTAHFPHLQTPALFVHGTRDGFGSIEEMQSALQQIPAQCELLTVKGAGHELLSKGKREAEAARIAQAFTSFAI